MTASGPHAREVWRYLDGGQQEAALAMAVDDHLLRGVAPGAPPVLHLWSWARPALTFGYGQCHDILDRSALDAAGIAVVRRPTGGKVVLHRGDIGYGCLVPRPYRDWEAGLRPAYHFVAAAVRHAMASVGVRSGPPARERGTGAGVAVCGDEVRAYELLADGAKVLGSAQRRTRTGVLIQGTIAPGDPDDVRPFLARGVAGPEVEEEGGRPAGAGAEATGRSGAGPGAAPGVAGLTLESIRRGFEAVHGLELTPWRPDEEQASAIAALARSRYESRPWTERI